MLTIQKPGSAEQTINKSRFYASAAHCETEREVGLFLRQLAVSHQNAHHLAYAFRIKTADGIIPRFSDAGEPSGTAGKPIIQMLEARDLIHVAVGVIRYYGGVNLGTGGLARAYGGTAKMALDAAKIIPFVEMRALSVSVHYNQVDALTRLVAQLKGKVIDKKFDQAVHVKVSLPVTEVATFTHQYTQSI
ncbi:MAG: YigZ family protein [Methylotenera sp.]|nr:MAG: YigZ family protein [Methylotenera sp.]